MFLFSKYFTSAVRESDRHRMSESFGLNELTFQFAEIHQGTLLRLVNVSPSQVSYEIRHRTQEEWLGELQQNALPGIARLDGMAQEARSEVLCQLWKELFPFPLKALALSVKETGVWIFSNEAWKADLTNLVTHFEQLESKMHETELSVLLIEGAAVRSEVLFHFVRKRLVSWALVPELSSLWSEEITPELLKERFGTTVQVIQIDVSKYSQSKLISDLAQAVLPKTEVSTRPLFAAPVFAPVTQFEL